ncbi:MAG: acetoacetate--CoA ligase [Porticoccaceae bacterium]|nr:acetoacetate--CoA ligase [Pseudomonadales bacterium]
MSGDSVMPRGKLLRPVPDDAFDTSTIGEYCCWLKQHHQLDFKDYGSLWRWSVDNLEAFWQSIIDFFDLDVGSPEQILDEQKMPGANWLPGASLSYPEHVLRHSGSQPALVGISQSRGRVSISRDELREQVARCAAGLKKQGVKRGDRVAAYLPNIPEATIAFLATASIGAIWVSCAPEFGAKAVIDRFCQVEPTLLIAVAGYQYGDKPMDRREHLSEIRKAVPSIKQVIDVPYAAGMQIDQSMDWSELLAELQPLSFEKVSADYPLYVLFSSGTTGLPKAIVHGHGGILLEHCKAIALHNDVRDGDSFFWFSTTGWMVWNYGVSALVLGASMVCFDGNPMWPDASNLWAMAADEKVDFFGNSATFYMACRDKGLEPCKQFDLSAIRTITSTGSTLPAEGFDWIYSQFDERVILSSAAGGTDICSAFVAASPIVPVRAGEISAPLLGCDIAALDDSGEEVLGQPGELVIKTPMPSMPVAFWGDDGSRLNDAYFDQNPGLWTHGDWIIVFDDGASVITGRSDSTLNRGGVRLGTADFYSVVEEIPGVEDSLVVHLEDASGGMGRLTLFAVAESSENQERLGTEINQRLKNDLSPRHVPDEIVWLSAIPRTLTGKKIEAPIKKLLKGVPMEKVANVESLVNGHALQEILQWHSSASVLNSDKKV